MHAHTRASKRRTHRPVLAGGHLLAQVLGEALAGLKRLLAGVQALCELYQRHDGHGVHEVHADLWCCCVCVCMHLRASVLWAGVQATMRRFVHSSINAARPGHAMTRRQPAAAAVGAHHSVWLAGG
jgi:hypothetical protein